MQTESCVKVASSCKFVLSNGGYLSGADTTNLRESITVQ